MMVERITILGNGLMASGIAQILAQYGFEVTMWSRRGIEGLFKLNENIQKAVDKKIFSESQAKLILSRITCTSTLSASVETADLIIEAVVEDLDVKKTVFKEASAFCLPKAILVSNTSSLSISNLAVATKRPDKIAGMHFFNPPYAMKLVEVVKTPQTSEATVNTILELCETIEKVPLVVKDTPGFVVNRILMPAINSAAFVLMEGVASADIIDSAMKLGANYPMGPLALADLIGIDTCLKIMEEFCSNLEHAGFQICPLFEKMIVQGNLGRKTGKGFFTYKL